MPRARLGVVVSKKGNAKAVRRNRIKRLVRERFRLSNANLPNVDLALQVFAPIADADLVENIDRLFEKVKAHYSDDE